jgi:tetratricopeptide (TPR) repeat protein
MLGRMRYKTVPRLGLVLLVMVTAACSLSPAETAYNRGVDYADQGDSENAIEEYDEIIRLDPQNAAAYSRRGYEYGALGRHKRAVAGRKTGQ